MGPKLDVKVGDEVAVVGRYGVSIVKVSEIRRGSIVAGNTTWRADGSSRSTAGYSQPHLEIVTDEHRAAVAEETERSRVRRAIDRFPELRNHLPAGRTELLREVAEHLEAALALLDGAK
jgi:hypothetical protein